MSAMDVFAQRRSSVAEVKSCLAGRCFVLQETKGGGFFDGNSLCPSILVMVPEISFPTTWNGGKTHQKSWDNHQPKVVQDFCSIDSTTTENDGRTPTIIFAPFGWFLWMIYGRWCHIDFWDPVFFWQTWQFYRKVWECVFFQKERVGRRKWSYPTDFREKFPKIIDSAGESRGFFDRFNKRCITRFTDLSTNLGKVWCWSSKSSTLRGLPGCLKNSGHNRRWFQGFFHFYPWEMIQFDYHMGLELPTSSHFYERSPIFSRFFAGFLGVLAGHKINLWINSIEYKTLAKWPDTKVVWALLGTEGWHVLCPSL